MLVVVDRCTHRTRRLPQRVCKLSTNTERCIEPREYYGLLLKQPANPIIQTTLYFARPSPTTRPHTSTRSPFFTINRKLRCLTPVAAKHPIKGVTLVILASAGGRTKVALDQATRNNIGGLRTHVAERFFPPRLKPLLDAILPSGGCYAG